MLVHASAPGKAVLLGEYVVLDGARALVMACGRRCEAAVGPADGEHCRLELRMPDTRVLEFEAGQPTGSALVDAVLEVLDLRLPWTVWCARIDTSAFFADGLKLGLGSSAAALVAFAGAAWTAAGNPGKPGLRALIQCHRAFQGGAGSGIDVAASVAGGSIEFRLNPDAEPWFGSVRLPKSVGFAGIFAGGSASTPDLVGQYRQWADEGTARAAALRQRMFDVAQGGCAAVEEDDAAAFVAAIEAYGVCLAELGREIGTELVTGAHRRIGDLAARFGLAYKTSGAGGGDLGIACGLDADALGAFAGEAANQGFYVVPLASDVHGMRIEEHAE